MIKKIGKSLLEKEAVNLPARLLVRSILHSEILPVKLNRKIFDQIANRIPLSSVNYFGITVHDREKLIFVSPSSSSIARLLYWWGFHSTGMQLVENGDGYQPETVRLFCKLAENARTIFDIGTNIGTFALIAGVINKTARIFAFEPMPFIFELLKKNISINKLFNITPIQKPVSDVDGMIPFYINLGSDQSSSTLEGFRQDIKEIEVCAVTLDTFVEEENIDQVDLIKIDAEGQDHRVLGGMRRILQRDQPDIICEVLHGRTEKELQNILSDFGYQYYWITDDGLIPRDIIVGDSEYRYFNYLFTKKESLETIK